MLNTAKQTEEIKDEKCAAEECCWGRQPAETLLLKKEIYSNETYIFSNKLKNSHKNEHQY